MNIDNKFEIRQTVYLITDEEQKPRVITSISVQPNDLLYVLACGRETSEHFDFEISDKPNIMITSTN